jgi:uncharacterized membrane protein (UPF0182 family)
MSSSPTSKGGRLLAIVVGVLVLVFIAGRIASGLLVEVLWQGQVGYLDVFLTRELWQWGIRIVAGLAVGILIFFNLRLVAGTLSGIRIKRRFGNIEIAEQLPKHYVLWAMLGISGVLALWFGAAVPRSVGIQALMLIHGGAWGITDPIMGRDAGFYVFWVPLLGSGVTFSMVVAFLLFTLVTAGYAATGAVRWTGKKVVSQRLARLHLGGILAAFLLLLAFRLWLGRYLLLLDGSSSVQGIVGFTDAQARLPALETMTVIAVLAAAGSLWGAWKGRGLAILGSVGSMILAGLIIGEFYPAMVQRFQVQPNELDRETPYIEANLEFTRKGFGLDRMERRAFSYTPEEQVDQDDAARQLAGFPVWGEDPLLTTFREVEARFPYYNFTDVTIDRYPTPDGPVPLAVSVREIDPQGIQDPNWQNLHLRERYVEGMGAVASLASSRTTEGRPPMVLSGIPPAPPEDTPYPGDLALPRPQVFFGGNAQLYAAVEADSTQFTAPDGTLGEVGVDLPAGIELSSSLRTFALAWQFRDANLLFATELTNDSRFIFRRRVLQRVRAIAPFLRYPEAPYPVISGGRIIWVLEGYTATRAFPLSSDHDLAYLNSVSYLRNSVKVTVDAVTGEVAFYRVPVDDPLADAYAGAFSGLFRSMDEMPADLRAHIRYPRSLLNLQSQVLLQYHMETARAFHGQQDVWALPQELARGTSPVAYRPEYAIYRLPGEDEASFRLTTVFVPAGRQNLTAILTGRTDDRGVPELVLHDVSVEDQAPGPRQIEALVEQDPRISQQFSLWRTGGSEVWTGHLHLVPVGGRLLYMEPVYLAAEADAIPELRRFVVSDGVRVAMTEELSDAVAFLAGGAAPAAEGAATALDTGEAGNAATALPMSAWPQSALDLLDQAESRLRDGDWQGFGAALQELRTLLQGLSSGQGGPGG